jgi:hypothetical protein
MVISKEFKNKSLDKNVFKTNVANFVVVVDDMTKNVRTNENDQSRTKYVRTEIKGQSRTIYVRTQFPRKEIKHSLCFPFPLCSCMLTMNNGIWRKSI